ncbi:ribosomal-processing cysteine protease Prp [Limnochorda pilosa]|uniref:Ribosomal processing cysteine protease Prp n=1 Tax=Limnochorda pilosa TaxID=1555112 RepID=A0A0K2SNA0_LIMPI|nr:ribosomal-processing cysteine protease Prp [Limnochorda pilosa]BAS28608.1 hypothetical protein LIP_2779 [Limnochorda pilosa]
MVRVELYQAGPGELTGFRAVGHAGYAPAGEDIVCAGVSAVTQACVLGLKEHLALPISLKAEDGLLECRLPKEIPEEKRAPARAILETMVLALREIEKGHGRYFALISLDAPRSSHNRNRGRERADRRGGRPQEGRRQASQAVASRPDRSQGALPTEGRPAPEAAERRADGGRSHRGGHRRRREERGERNGAPAAVGQAEAKPVEAAPVEEAPEVAPRRTEERKPPVEREPDSQVAVAQEPAAEAGDKPSILNPFRRKRLRSFRPGRLGRRWRP